MKVKINACDQDLEIHLEEYGKSNKGMPILFVHGIPTNAKLWRHVQKNLENDFHSYAMDMVGYGQSSMPLDNFEHTFNNQAEAIKGVIEELGLKGNVILVGHDHGGGVCQVFASKYCDYISRLVLLNPVAYDYWPVLEVEAFNGLVGASDEVLAGAMPGAVAQFAGLMRTGSHDKIAFTDKNVKENYLCHWGRDGLTGFKSLVKICSQPTNEETLAVDHKKITCPTAVFWALHDAWMPKESGERLKQDIAGPVRLQFIERAGHWSQEDRPDEVAAMIEDFITEWEGVKI